jgi:N-carbamoylputrescine amidase
MSKVKVGTVQMTCVKDKETNLQKAIEKVREVLQKVLKLFVCKNFLRHFIFVM